MDALAKAKLLIDEFLSRAEQPETTLLVVDAIQAGEDRRVEFEKALIKLVRLDFAVHLSELMDFMLERRPDHPVSYREYASAMNAFGFICIYRDDHMSLAEKSFAEAYHYRSESWKSDPREPYTAYLYGVALWHMAKLQDAWGDAHDDYGYASQEMIDAAYDAEIPWAQKARRHLAMIDTTWPNTPIIKSTLKTVEDRLRKLEVSFDDDPPSTTLAIEPTPEPPTELPPAHDQPRQIRQGLWQRIRDHLPTFR